MDTLHVIAPHSILSYDLRFGPHVIISGMLLQYNEQQRMISKNQLDIQKLIRLIKPFFANFFKYLFALETKLELIGKIIFCSKQTFN